MTFTEKLILKHTWLTRILCTAGFFRQDKEWQGSGGWPDLVCVRDGMPATIWGGYRKVVALGTLSGKWDAWEPVAFRTRTMPALSLRRFPWMPPVIAYGLPNLGV